MQKSIFHDPSGKKSYRVKIIFTAIVIILLILWATYETTNHSTKSLPQIEPYTQDNLKTNRSTSGAMREINTFAFHVERDEQSFSSLKKNIDQIDTIIAEQLLLNQSGIQFIDHEKTFRTINFLQDNHPEKELFAHIINYNQSEGKRDGDAVRVLMENKLRQDNLIEKVRQHLRDNKLQGVSIDFENLDEQTRKMMIEFTKRLNTQLKATNPNTKVAINLPYNNPKVPYQSLAENNDFIILMAYDQHRPGGEPGPIADIERYEKGMQFLNSKNKNKIIVALGNYSYTRNITNKYKPGTTLTRSETTNLAQKYATEHQRSEKDKNSFFTYTNSGEEYIVWALDSKSLLEQKSLAQSFGIENFALRRLGSEDEKIRSNQAQPNLQLDENKLLDHNILLKPETDKTNFDINNYKIYGIGKEKEILLTFDDGPSKHTETVLDILKEHQMKAIFFVIGQNVKKHPQIVKRMYNEGHVVANHTYNHSEVGKTSPKEFKKDIEKAQRLIQTTTNHKTNLFRAPRNKIDFQNPNPNEKKNLETLGDMGYYILGVDIDSDDRKYSQKDKVVEKVLHDAKKGHVALLHDGGGDRNHTVEALPIIIKELTKSGYKIVTPEIALGVAREKIMQPTSVLEKTGSKIHMFRIKINQGFRNSIKYIIIISIVLGTTRLLLLVFFALRKKNMSKSDLNSDYQPKASIIIPAYNEDTVIVKTVQLLLQSHYQNFEIIIVNDGSSDQTLKVTQQNFGKNKQVKIVDQTNGGKAKAVNNGISQSDGEIIIIQDADTILSKDALRLLTSHFIDKEVGGVSGNVKVGNTQSILGLCQSLEYTTAQSVDRSAFHMLNCITIVPGAIGARRKKAIDEVGGFSSDTLAEDADLTLNVLCNGWRVVYEDKAIGRTEAPTSIQGFLKQRFRWLFGTLQATWKSSKAIRRSKNMWLKRFSMPYTYIYHIFFPIINPTLDIIGASSFIFLLTHRSEKQDISSTTRDILLYSTIYFFISIGITLVAFYIEQKQKKAIKHIAILPIQRIFYRITMYWLSLKVIYTALSGKEAGRNKLKRTGTVEENIIS